MWLWTGRENLCRCNRDRKGVRGGNGMDLPQRELKHGLMSGMLPRRVQIHRPYLGPDHWTLEIPCRYVH
jgi:hypothetical protein